MAILDLYRPEPEYAENKNERRLLEYNNDIDHLQAVASHPTNPGWGATVYFDPVKYPDDFSQDRVWSYYARHHPGREFRFVELNASELEHHSPFLTKTAEKRFLNRGFYADIEAARYRAGQGDHVLTQSRLMRSACAHQLAKIAAFYVGEGDASIVWQEALGRLTGHFVVPVPLVKEDVVYWPRRKFPKPSTVHFAHVSTPESDLTEGRADEFGLTRATDGDIASQVAFESMQSARLFNGASREALFLWQTQTLALLRKSTWSALLSKNPNFRKFMEEFAKKRRELLKKIDKEGPDALKSDAPELEDPTIKSIAEMQGVYLDNLTGQAIGKYGPGLQSSDFCFDLELSEVLVAAIHGSTYCPLGDPEDEQERHDPLRTLFPVASWLGRLKRHRYLSLDEGMASMILTLASLTNDDETTYECPYTPLLRERFGGHAWDAIIEAAHEVLTQERSIPVRYDWTCDPAHPRSVERRNEGLVLVGPLLDFPLCDAAVWNQHALDLPNRLGLPGWN